MTLWLIVALAAMTYLSRVLGLALIPRSSERFEAVLERVPAPLFAGFAAIALVTEDRAAAPPETLVAVAAALLATVRTRSLLLILAAGLLGYGLGESIW